MLHFKYANKKIRKIYERAIRVTYKVNCSNVEDSLTNSNTASLHHKNLQLHATETVQSFLDMMKDLNFNEYTRKFILRKLMSIKIRSAYYILCRRNKDWLNPKLLTF